MSKTIPMLPSLTYAGGGIPDHNLTEEDLLWVVDGNTGNPNRDRKMRVSELRNHLSGVQYRVSGVSPGLKPTSGIPTGFGSPYFAEAIDLVRGGVYKATVIFRHTSALNLTVRLRIGVNNEYEFIQTHTLPPASASWVYGVGLEHQTIMQTVFTPNIGAMYVDGTGDNPLTQFIVDESSSLQYTGQTNWNFYGAQALFERIG